MVTVYRNENNAGIDRTISVMQDILNKEILSKWDRVNLFGRVYRNYRDGKYFPEVHTGKGEYKDVYFDDSKNASVFFIDSENHATNDGFTFETELSIVFMVDLNSIHKGRNDSLLHSDVIKVVKECFYSEFKMQELCKGVENCLSGFSTSKVNHLDIQPYHTFSIKGRLTYYINNCCNG